MPRTMDPEQSSCESKTHNSFSTSRIRLLLTQTGNPRLSRLNPNPLLRKNPVPLSALQQRHFPIDADGTRAIEPLRETDSVVHPRFKPQPQVPTHDLRGSDLPDLDTCTHNSGAGNDRLDGTASGPRNSRSARRATMLGRAT